MGIQKRKELKEAEVLAKKNYAGKKLEAQKAKHNEEYQKYMSKESVKKIDIARIAEKRAVDKKRRKASARAVAKAADKRRQMAKKVKEAFVKKGETQANVMLMAQEKVRKSSRRMDEAKELQDKVTVKDKLYFNQRATANKEVKAATKSLEDRNSAEGKKVGQKLLAKKRTDERTVKAEHECAARKLVTEATKEKY